MLIVNEDLMDLEDLTGKLTSEILLNPVFDRYKAAKLAVKNDNELQKKLSNLTENEEYVAFRPELRQLQKEVLMNEKIYALKIAENDVQEFLSDLTKKLVKSISEHIEVDENLPFSKGGKHGKHHG